MAFFEQQFPPLISINMSGGPRFLTDKASMSGGQRITNRRSQYPLHQYSFNKPTLSGAEFETLRSFFYVVGGDADGFRFKDWSDFIAVQSNTSATFISTNIYQLNRVYVFGSRTFTRPIYKPVVGATIYRTRSSVTTDITGTTTINFTTGRITVTGHADGDVYKWSGEFDVPVALRDSSAAWTFLGGPDMLTEWSGLEVEEIRV